MSCVAALMARIWKKARLPMVAITRNRKATMTKSLVLMEYLASTNVILGYEKPRRPDSTKGGGSSARSRAINGSKFQLKSLPSKRAGFTP
jgi:hypothetical protein